MWLLISILFQIKIVKTNAGLAMECRVSICIHQESALSLLLFVEISEEGINIM